MRKKLITLVGLLGVSACSTPVPVRDAGVDAFTSMVDTGESSPDAVTPVDTGTPVDAPGLDAPRECTMAGECAPAENATARCESNHCVYDCIDGFDDCDGALGCEQAIDVASHCGSCTNDCGATGYCEGGSCGTGVTVSWVRTITGLGPDQRGQALAARGEEVFSVGYVDGAGAVTFDGMTSMGLRGAYDSWIVSAPSDGTSGTLRSIAGAQEDVARAVLPLESGLVVVGAIRDYTTSPFPGGPAPGGGRDGFVARYGYDASTSTPSAVDVWAGASLDEVMGAVEARDGSFYVCGVFSAGARFGGGTAYSPAHGVDHEFVVVHYTASVTRDWATTIHATDAQYCQIALQGERVRLALTFGGDLEPVGMTPLHAEGLDFALLELNGVDGAVLGARQYGGSGRDVVTFLAANAAGELVASGSTNASLDVGGGAFTGTSEDAFAFGLHPDDAFAWQLIVRGEDAEQPTGLAMDGHGNSYLAFRSASAAFDAGAEHFSRAGSDWFGAVLSVDRDGRLRWTRLVPPTSVFAHPAQLAVAPSGLVFVQGQFAGTGRIEGELVDSMGGQDAFLMALDP
ncbi:MAG: hypothetical protein U0353_17635 [Sandaracinus sp.]